MPWGLDLSTAAGNAKADQLAMPQRTRPSDAPDKHKQTAHMNLTEPGSHNLRTLTAGFRAKTTGRPG